MKRAFLSAGGLFLAVALAPAVAQPPGATGGGSSPRLDAGVTTSADMQENVEILRRLLDKAFLDAYGLNAHQWGQQLPPNDSWHQLLPNYYAFADPTQPQEGQAWKNIAAHFGSVLPHTEGVYLKDYGVVFTSTLPLPPFSVVGGTGAAPAGKPAPDDWDRIRKELHGETPDQGAKAVPGHTPLSEVILKVLADNAKHFNNLGMDFGPGADDKKISVAVTFRGSATCANCHGNPMSGIPLATFGSAKAGASPPGTHLTPGGIPIDSGAGTAGAPGAPAAPHDSVIDARNDILLGDLHMKQGKTQDAIEAYNKASQRLQPILQYHEKWEPGLQRGDVPALLTAVDIGNKLAAAYVQAGNDQAASQTLKETANFAKQAEKLTGVAVPVGPAPQPAAQALPSKLIVTATKKQMDDVAAGKLTFEAFCKAAAVEYVTPPAEKK